MSYHAEIDGKYAGDVATVQGLNDLGRWIDRQKLDGNEDLIQLREHGHTYKPKSVAEQLHAALAGDPPEASVASTAHGLLSMLATAPEDGHFVIHDGTADDDE